MKKPHRQWLIVLAALSLLLGIPFVGYRFIPPPDDPFLLAYREHCAVCHGENLEGAAQGTPLAGLALRHGESVGDLQRSIRVGFPARGMPAWGDILSDGDIASLAMLIAERRQNLDMRELRVNAAIVVPRDRIETEHHPFRFETRATGLDPQPFSIALLPDGDILLSEKTRGLSLVGQDGHRSAPVAGTPPVYADDISLANIGLGLGWFLDVALHPDHAANGWIYLHYADRCSDCNKVSRLSPLPVSMNRVDRARIRNHRWVDVETIWRADIETYTSLPDIAAGGRIAFDDQGHVFISVGMKGGAREGIQDLALPYGKIHRMRDDGSIPVDNPFTGIRHGDREAPLPSIWTYGHRNPQGLEFNPLTRELWGSEMGPRGGDEINRLLPGRNYGWPHVSKGVDYDGTPVEYWKDLGIEFDVTSVEAPVVDFSPSPAISSFVFYDGDAFPAWRGNIIVGSLKAGSLFRLVIRGGVLVHRETLISSLARIRDVEVDAAGFIYLLLESRAGSQIVRMVPDT